MIFDFSSDRVCLDQLKSQRSLLCLHIVTDRQRQEPNLRSTIEAALNDTLQGPATTRSLFLAMAEQELYGNDSEPKFPFELIRGMCPRQPALMLGQLSWLRSFLEENITEPENDLNPLLNTVLVFARARTSTFQNITSWEKVSKLAKKLNQAAEVVGASQHCIELVPRGPKTYFVVCRHSPRFIWNVSLTHHDVGKNLDFFAPGHMPTEPPSEECVVSFIEKNSFEDITGEGVFIEYLKDEIKPAFTQYNSRRETLLNSTMQELGLDYRFKCLVTWPDTLQAIPSMMTKPNPPSAQWWDDHCYFVNFGLPGILLHPNLAFCGWKTNYTLYWPLIQGTFEFMMKYKRHEYWYASADTGTSFWNSMETTFREIKSMGEGDLDPNSTEFQEFLTRIRVQFNTLAKAVEDSSRATEIKPSVRRMRRAHSPSLAFRLGYKWLVVKETLALHVFHRDRLAPKVSTNGIGYPTSGDKDAFQWFK